MQPHRVWLPTRKFGPGSSDAKSTPQPSSLDTNFICGSGLHSATQFFLMILLTCDYYILSDINVFYSRLRYYK